MMTKPRIRRYSNIDKTPIDKYVALAICKQIRTESYRNLSFAQRCKRCVFGTKDGIPDLLGAKPGYRGCKYVNSTFKKMMED